MRQPRVEIARDAQQLDAHSGAGRYVAALMRKTPAFYVDSAQITFNAVLVDGQILPLVVNPGTTRNPDICSPLAHYYLYTLDEFWKRHPRIPRSVRNALISIGALLQRGSIDKVVSVNNWLLATNPLPHLSSPQIEAVTRRLVDEYPEAVIVFRSVNPEIDPSGCRALIDSRYRLVRSRRVYVLKGYDERFLHRPNVRVDLKLLRNSPYNIMDCQKAIEAYVPRMARLYQELYLNKHSRLNPRYNSEFFRLTLREDIITYRAFVMDGRVDAFIGYFIQDDVMTAAIMGYDQNLARKLGLYRMAIAEMIAEASRWKLRLNLSGGVGRFKMLRGAVPVEEFDAVYDRHLPRHRRLVWSALRLGGHLGSGVPPGRILSAGEQLAVRQLF